MIVPVGKGKEAPSGREIFALLALTILLLGLTAFLPDQTFVREARNKASDWLISLQPTRNPTAALGHNVLLVRVNEGAISRQYPGTFANWKDPPILLERDHIADMVDRFARMGASTIAIVVPFPRTPTANATDHLADILDFWNAAERGPNILLLRRARPEIGEGALGYADAAPGSCLHGLDYDSRIERALAARKRLYEAPFYLLAEGNIIRYVPEAVAFCQDSGHQAVRFEWTLPKTLSMLAHGPVNAATKLATPKDCLSTPNTYECLARVTREGSDASEGGAQGEFIQFAYKNLDENVTSMAEALLADGSSLGRLVANGIVVVELGPGVAGTTQKPTPVGNESLGEVLIAAAATFAKPEPFSCTSAGSSFAIQLAAAFLVSAVLLWGSRQAVKLIEAGVAAVGVLLTGLAATYFGLVQSSCAVWIISDIGLGAACALLAHGLTKLIKGASKLISALRRTVLPE
jgi:hypothetical protein